MAGNICPRRGMGAKRAWGDAVSGRGVVSASVTGKKLGEHKGKVARLGAGGDGLIQCSTLRKEADFKANFVVGPQPAGGDRGGFGAAEYPRGKSAARDVAV